MKLDREPNILDIGKEMALSSAKFGVPVAITVASIEVIAKGGSPNILIGAFGIGGASVLLKFFFSEEMLISRESSKFRKQVDKNAIK